MNIKLLLKALVLVILLVLSVGALMAKAQVEPSPSERGRVIGVKMKSPSRLTVPAVPMPEEVRAAGWADMMKEDFETAFPGNTWQLYGNPTWASKTYRKYAGNLSGYGSGGGSQGVPPPGPYPAHVGSWMIAGPFDFSEVTDAELTFYVWQQTEFTSDSKSDDRCVFASVDGEWFHGECQSGDLTQEPGNVNGWIPASFDLTDIVGLGSTLGHSTVWIAFVFVSDATVSDEGVYLDDIALRVHTGPTPTPTPVTPTPTPRTCPGAAEFTYITREDNENNTLSGQPDNDMFPGTEHCIYRDDPRQPIEFRIHVPKLPFSPTNASLSLLAYDVDEQEQSCPEVDTVRFNEVEVGNLTGADNSWSTTVIEINPQLVVEDGNLVQVLVNTANCPNPDDPDDPKGRWCTLLDWGQLVLADSEAPATLRSVSPDFTCYAPGATMHIEVEADTTLSNQEVTIEVNLLAANKDNLAGASKIKTIRDTQDDAISFALSIPVDSDPGDYTLQVILSDTCSGTQSDYTELIIPLDTSCGTPTATPTPSRTPTPSLTPTPEMIPLFLPVIVQTIG